MRRFVIALLTGGALTALAVGVALQSELFDGAGGAPALTRDDVRQAQHQLKVKGLYDGQIDGVVGPQTAEALRRYQRDNGLPETAALDPSTAGRLTGAPPPTASDAGDGDATRNTAGGRDATRPPLKLR
jgi:peptidoglycan hydrolase-like protein with peptidoglycan-binding domain